MKIRIKERADSHGSQIEHYLDLKEDLDKITFSALDKTVVVACTTCSGETKIKLNGYLDTIKMESYSI